MTITIVKNDSFETVGILFHEGNTTYFSWGISPSRMSWTKDVPFGDHVEDFVQLITLRERLHHLERFVRDWFDVVHEDNKDRDILNLKEGEGVKFAKNEKLIEETRAKIESIIKSIQ